MKRIIWSRIFRSMFPGRHAARTRKASKRLPQVSVRPVLETLEDRTLPSNIYTVTQLGDAGNGTITATGGTGDIRFCVNQADLNPGSTITFASALSGQTIALNNGELPIKVNMTITGLGASNLIINGTGSAGASRVFDITSSVASVTISNLTITGGNAEVANTKVTGNQGGDIFNGGTLILQNDVVSNGTSSGSVGGPTGRGGAIYNAEGATSGTGATLILDNTKVENSTASGSGNQGAGEGGGIYNDTNATLIVKNGSQIVNNLAIGSFASGGGLGGGIFNNTGARLQLNGSSTSSIVIADNLARAADGISFGAAGGGANGARGGAGGKGATGTSGGNAFGGGVFNTGASFTLQYVNFLGNQAIAGNGGNGGGGGAGGSGTSLTGGTGGAGGGGGAGGSAQGGGIYNAQGTLTVPNVVFGVDSNGRGNQVIAGTGGAGASGGAGGKGKTLGGAGGAGGVGGAGGAAKGGAVADKGGNVSFTNTTFTSNEAIGIFGGNAGSAGNAGPASGNGAKGGVGGAGKAGGRGGDAVGGAVFNSTGNLSINGGTFAGNQALANVGGTGGGGGVGGTGGPGTSKVAGGVGGAGGGGGGGTGGAGGNAQGGGFYNLVGTVTINGTSFQANSKGTGNQAISGGGGGGGMGGNGGQGGDNSSGTAGAGGAAGVGGQGGSGGLAEGGAGGNQGGDTTVTKATFTSSLVQTGTGGAGNSGGTGGSGGNGSSAARNGAGGAGGAGGTGGTGGTGFGGALAVTTSNLTVSNSTFGGKGVGNQVIGGMGGGGGTGGTLGTAGHPGGYVFVFPTGNGGQGGQGASVSGGALSAGSNTLTIKITGSTFANNSIASGAGGAGGQGGSFSAGGAHGGLNGPGGSGGLAQGGAIALSTNTSQSATLTNDTVTSTSATSGVGGAGTISANGAGSTGGSGGTVQGVGLADVNYNLTVTSSSFTGGTGIGGTGGTGGSASATQPYTFRGGNGGVGGNVMGGGVFVSNNLAASQSSSFNGDPLSNNNLTGGLGGGGGNAGASGQANITGGAGGNGGPAQGGGLYILASTGSINNASLANLTLAGNDINGGAGGAGGAGYNAIGGKGGAAQGGAVFNTSLNTVSGQSSSLSLTGSTVTGNQANGGVGGNAGSGTTPNGGAGGAGGSGGNADGAGLYNGDNSPVTVINSTFGGSSSISSTPTVNYNVLSGGRGGSGGNAGTPSGVPSNNGGPGGAGGSIFGGNVYNSSTGAVFINDTLVFGQAVAIGSGGPGGSGAGKTGQSGAAGANGVGFAGGYFAAQGSTDTVGNTIIDLNNANVVPSVSPDVSGTFSSVGNNILGRSAGVNGFTKLGDQINVTAAQLNLGPLLPNGGPTLTDALLGGSYAINAGSNTLVTSTTDSWHNFFGTNPTDQRGPGFVRIAQNKVDVGAFEYQAPVITNLSPNSEPEQGVGLPGTTFNLIISGTGFEPGLSNTPTTVSFNGTTLYPTAANITPTQITVAVPLTLLNDEGTANVTVSIPDGSGTGTLTSAPAIFTITEAPSFTLSNPGSQTNNESDTLSAANKNLVQIASSDPDTVFNDQVSGQDTLPPGLSIDPNTGVISGTINPYAVTNGQPSQNFTVTINGIDSDSNTTETIQFTWTVNDTTPPTLTAPSNQTSDEGQTIKPLPISAQDADAGTFTDVVNGSHTLPPGLTIDPNLGTISGTTNARAAGTYTVTISASDNGNVGSTSFTWTVLDTTPPSFTIANQNTSEGYTVPSPGLATNPVDAGPGSITDVVNGKHTLPPGLSIDSTTGQITGTIGAYAAGIYTVTISATDGTVVGSTNFTWTVNDTTPPSFTIGNQSSNEGFTVPSPGLATNPVDADSGSINDLNAKGQHTLPLGLSIDSTTGQITGTIGAYAASIYTVTISATDGTVVGNTNFTWTVADKTPPSFTNPGTQNNNEGDKITGLATLPVDADPKSITATDLPPGLTIDSTSGVISGTINKYGAGAYNVTVSASDGTGNVGSIQFTWNVADTTPPALTNPGTVNNNEGDNVGLQIRAVDGESFSATGLPKGLNINPNTGLISGTIDPYGAGTYPVSVTANDGTLSSNINFTWNVADSSPPSFTNPGTLNNNEGDTVSLALNPVDADPGSITATGLPTGLSINANTGVISGIIDSRAAGTYTVTVSATDGSIAGNTTFTWNVADTTPPTLTNPGMLNSLDDTAVSVAIHAVDGESFSATGLPAGLSINPKTGVISGTIISPAQTYQVTVTASDGGTSSSITFPWVVNQVPVSVAIANVQNTYIGLYQLETVTVEVTDSAGLPVNEGIVTFQVNGETLTAPVNNGFATVTFVTPMLSLDQTILLDDFLTHALRAIYSDSANVFGSGSASLSEPGMLLDFMIFLQASQFGSLATQLAQLQK